MKRIVTDEEKKFISLLIRSGISMSVTILGGNYWVNEEQIAFYLSDSDGFVASLEGVTVDELHAFKAAEGGTPCSATTKKGLPCKNYVPNGYPDQWGSMAQRGVVRAWLDRQGQYCSFHAEARDVGRR